MHNHSACELQVWAGLHQSNHSLCRLSVGCWVSVSHVTSSVPVSLPVQVGKPPSPYARDTSSLWTETGKVWEGGSAWWYLICPILEVGFCRGTPGHGQRLPPLPSQHGMKSKTPSSLCRALRLSIWGADFNIYLLLLHPQKSNLLWGAINKPLTQYSSSLTAYVDSPKERGQH